MTPAEAHAIAAEHVAWWQRHGFTANEAWSALNGGPVWHADWWEVRGCMTRWLLREYGPLPATTAHRLAA